MLRSVLPVSSLTEDSSFRAEDSSFTLGAEGSSRKGSGRQRVFRIKAGQFFGEGALTGYFLRQATAENDPQLSFSEEFSGKHAQTA